MKEAARRRREFIRANHPDRGGDPDVFMSGLRSFDVEWEPDSSLLPPVVVVRRQVWVVRLASGAIQRLHPRPPRVR